MTNFKSKVMRLTILATLAAATLQPGTSSASQVPCKSVGKIRLLESGRFKCTQVGGTRVWKKISSTNNSSLSPSTTSTTTTLPYGYLSATCGPGLIDCPPISQELADIESCKIRDATPGDVAQGFPRPRFAKPGKASIKILFVPVRYSDSAVDEETVIADYQKVFDKAQKFFAKNSYRRVTPLFILEPESQWIQINQTYKEFSNSRNGNLLRITQDLVTKIPRQTLQEFDSVFIVAAGGTEVGGGMEQSATYSHGNEMINSVYLQTGPAEKSELAHGLGHSLYYFEDLYLQSFFRTSPNMDFWPMRHDVMGDGEDYSAWNRWLAGFLSDSEILCMSPNTSDSTIHLSYLNSPNGKKLAVIPLSFGRAIFLEHIDFAIHVYELNSFIGHGAGPLKTLGTAGVGKSVSSGSFDFAVVSADSNGLFVRIKKRDS